MSDSIHRLHDAVVATRRGRLVAPRTTRLFAKGRHFIAKKVAEEAVEVSLDAVQGDIAGAIRESADLIYNLVVLWVELGILPADVWAEMDRREALLGLAEKLPKRSPVDGAHAVTLDLLALSLHEGGDLGEAADPGRRGNRRR
ncbi:phosphoribosyl-ATP diphosphatase [Ancylobacter sp. WKF20]|uniref:phosphoribosyl-ATP diphosphatase n=1 Tax=Ancylobacter sp. WKF20 TaxID=3039801 RepID=UPI0024343926|nr:phosphoribosyl-ATP diphosphatase [Ancylobacter sp. WKF20]WGD28887.1 phosphoribosyl-ATP diphosphatase [Ancylobacter sp. WKF20]